MIYSLIEEPIVKPFSEMTRKEAKIYFNWFVEQIPIRVSVLQQAVRSSSHPKFQEWVADKMPNSLIVLGEWLGQELTTRPLSAQDRELIARSLEQVPAKYRSIFSEPEQVFTDKSYSLIRDVGMYLGEVFRGQVPQLEWQLFNKSKKYADYHQPVLLGFREIECNTVNLVHVIALGLVDRTVEPSRLYEIYNYWIQQIFQPTN